MTASTAKQEVRPTPRGTHPNSLANLAKGRKFTASDDSARKAAAKASAEKRSLAEEMRALLDEDTETGKPRRKALAAKLILNMEKSPEWYKLGLRIMGELPAENVNINTPDPGVMDEIRRRMAGDGKC